ncbi:hypothetical protein ACO22_02963 [Paracoccidioides brasiliensis]|uniref:Uncharacterized protein n=1 Tax=Paracoccidioides brasiliensis TaxID=121759 RepID=A0A1D2JHB5_PARBR|nr:hypothetical protein ACO22_02963 [Paracoccidioides brasiliensis]
MDDGGSLVSNTIHTVSYRLVATSHPVSVPTPSALAPFLPSLQMQFRLVFTLDREG